SGSGRPLRRAVPPSRSHLIRHRIRGSSDTKTTDRGGPSAVWHCRPTRAGRDCQDTSPRQPPSVQALPTRCPSASSPTIRVVLLFPRLHPNAPSPPSLRNLFVRVLGSYARIPGTAGP